jgi:hypothetical protein
LHVCIAIQEAVVPRRDHAGKLSTGSTTPGRGRARLAAIGLAALAVGAVAAPAQAQDPVGAGIGTSPIGPIVERFGFFPEYYTDAVGARAQLCLEDPSCAVVLPNPAQPMSFPGNFPDEMFYWSANATAGGADLILAQEATFDGVDGNQAVFGRLRVRTRNIPADTYRFTTPYGQFTATTNGQTDVGTDVGCGPVIGLPCTPTTFQDSRGSAIGPNFLRSTTAPAGFLGDGVSATPVTGSVFTPTLASVDGLPPAISLTVNATNNAQNAAGTVAVQFNPSALDDVDGVRPANCTPTPARLPAAATTDTTCTSTDVSIPPNTGSRVFHVAVPDTTPPHITLPTTAAAGAGSPVAGYPVTFNVSADDIIDGNRPVTCNPASGDVFGVGTTTVTCTSSDVAGNTATDKFDVTVTPNVDPTTATVVVDNPVISEPVGNVVPVVTADAQVNPAPAIANYFRVDRIDGTGKIVGHFGGSHRTTAFTVLGKLADAVPLPQFLSSGGAFGAVHVGDPLTQTITVRNGGSGPLNLTTAAITGSTDFALISNGCAAKTVDPAPRTEPPTTPANPPCAITVRFTPSAVANRTATLTVNEGGTPHTVALTGAGTLAAIATNPQGLSFGSQSVGLSTAPQTITVTNTGGSPLHVTGTSFIDAAGADYNATPTGCTNVPAGGTCSIEVMFTPTAAGVRNARLQIATNEAGVKSVPVSGIGVAGPVPAGGGAVTAPVITPELLAPVVPIDQPVAASKKSLRSLTLKVGPKRDALLPLQFTISGELKVPRGTSLKSTCTGNVTITLKRGLKNVVKSTPKLRLIANKTRCVYSSKVTITSRALVGARTTRLLVGVRYAGSSVFKFAARSKFARIR